MDQVTPSGRYTATTHAAREYKRDLDQIIWPMAQDVFKNYKRGHRAKKSHQRRNEFILWILGRKKD
jgi:hypothetical protein